MYALTALIPPRYGRGWGPDDRTGREVRIIKYLVNGRIDIIHILKGFEAG